MNTKCAQVPLEVLAETLGVDEFALLLDTDVLNVPSEVSLYAISMYDISCLQDDVFKTIQQYHTLCRETITEEEIREVP